MLALAIISTVILAILISVLFGATVLDSDDVFVEFTLVILLSFVIVTIWVLYAR